MTEQLPYINVEAKPNGSFDWEFHTPGTQWQVTTYLGKVEQRGDIFMKGNSKSIRASHRAARKAAKAYTKYLENQSLSGRYEVPNGK